MSARILFSLILLLAACAPRGDITIAPEAAGVGHVERIYIATNRTPDGRGQEQVSFGRVDVSVPPERQPGSITYPRRGQGPIPDATFWFQNLCAIPAPGISAPICAMPSPRGPQATAT
ncbi:hypothetical protein ACFSS8_11760 [Paracoccus kondratievae]